MRKMYGWSAVVVVAGLMVLARVQSPQRPTGTLRLITPNAAIRLQSDSRRVTLSREQGPAKLFAGTYIPMDLALIDGQYRLACRGPFGKLSAITILDNQTETLDFGPPLKVTADVMKLRGAEVSIGVDVTGKAGEIYFPAAEKNDVRLSPPGIKIYDEKGKVLHSGTFEFG